MTMLLVNVPLQGCSLWAVAELREVLSRTVARLPAGMVTAPASTELANSTASAVNLLQVDLRRPDLLNVNLLSFNLLSFNLLGFNLLNPINLPPDAIARAVFLPWSELLISGRF
jgi:uncharacterized protein YjbI with pentapeptide repeats